MWRDSPCCLSILEITVGQNCHDRCASPYASCLYSFKFAFRSLHRLTVCSALASSCVGEISEGFAAAYLTKVLNHPSAVAAGEAEVHKSTAMVLFEGAHPAAKAGSNALVAAGGRTAVPQPMAAGPSARITTLVAQNQHALVPSAGAVSIPMSESTALAPSGPRGHLRS